MNGGNNPSPRTLSPLLCRGAREKIGKSQLENIRTHNLTRMLKTGILNPRINSLLARVRHTNTLVIADRGFPFWPEIETVDISLVDGLPTVLQVLNAIRPNFAIGKAWMANEFVKNNDAKTRAAFAKALHGIKVTHENHVDFKKRVPSAIGLIRTGDMVPYANLILESA